jgi:predicted NUDIX family phosphoesterase/dephospho-CoA kinase
MASEFIQVAEHVLEKYHKPLTAREIVTYAYEHGLFSDKISGKTPHQTMKSKLSTNIRRDPEGSIFVRTEAGKFYLRRLLGPNQQIYKAPPYKKPQSKEKVLVIPISKFDPEERFQGIKERWRAFTNKHISETECEYIDRFSAEQTEEYKQVLTYILVTRKNSVLSYKRGSYNRVESFLRGSHCIGFGGHVSNEDNNLFSRENMGIYECAVRELSEELSLPNKDIVRLQHREGLSIIGILNDDSSAVGRRHIAYILNYEVSDDPSWDKPTRGEKSITQLQWLNENSNPVPIWHFEYWSQLCLRTFHKSLVQTSHAYRAIRKTPMTPPHVLCVLGEVGSGKSEATKILKEEYGYSEVNTGKLIAEIIKLPPVPETPREIFQKSAWEFISKKKSPQIFAQKIIDEINKHPSPRILVDGIRQRDTLAYLKKMLSPKNVGCLYIQTPPDLAYEFYISRERSDFTIMDFLNVRHAQVESEVGGMISESDTVIYNWVGLTNYRTTVRKLIDSLQISKERK